MRICTIKTIAADLTLFVDNSFFQDEKVDYAAYATVQLNSAVETFTTIQARMVVQLCSPQPDSCL